MDSQTTVLCNLVDAYIRDELKRRGITSDLDIANAAYDIVHKLEEDYAVEIHYELTKDVEPCA